MTEARTSHAANLETVARATAGGYIISGEKTSVTMLANAEAIILAVTKVEAARMICYAALEKRTLGLPHTIDAAMAKWYGPFVANAAVKECLLLHGNYGYSQELPFEQRLRDVMSVEIADGTARIQKIIIMRERYGTDFVPYEWSGAGTASSWQTGPARPAPSGPGVRRVSLIHRQLKWRAVGPADPMARM
ncbi:hypothetical protein Rruber_05277 (plasmid) [Rhodococcus ruber]|uniref:acyl-CoA dehydrogenase family protein n=1 Tax=Rhodococcus ruber TaxID=1830 RepID=UPI00315D2396